MFGKDIKCDFGRSNGVKLEYGILALEDEKFIYLVVDCEVNLQICVHATFIYYEQILWGCEPTGRKW